MNRRRYFWFSAVLVLVTCLALAGCAKGEESEKQSAENSKLKVYTTIYPLYDFTKNIGGDRIDVSYLVQPGSEPHEWEPSPRDLAELQKASVFIYNGAGMEHWIDKTLQAINSPNLVVINASQGLTLISGGSHSHGPDDAASHESEEKHGHEEEQHRPDSKESDHGHGQEPQNKDSEENDHGSGTDPHIWVDPVNAVKMVQNITAGLVQADPDNQEFYESNAAAYVKQLEELDQAYRQGLAGATRKEFVTSHDAFGYLARRYGLVQVPIRGLSPEVEPTPTKMAEVVKMAREKNVRYIFFESLISPKISEVIAKEVGAETLVLNPLGGLTPDEQKAGKDYLSVMRDNLANLQKGLEVKQ